MEWFDLFRGIDSGAWGTTRFKPNAWNPSARLPTTAGGNPKNPIRPNSSSPLLTCYTGRRISNSRNGSKPPIYQIHQNPIMPGSPSHCSAEGRIRVFYNIQDFDFTTAQVEAGWEKDSDEIYNDADFPWTVVLQKRTWTELANGNLGGPSAWSDVKQITAD